MLVEESYKKMYSVANCPYAEKGRGGGELLLDPGCGVASEVPTEQRDFTVDTPLTQNRLYDLFFTTYRKLFRLVISGFVRQEIILTVSQHS